MKESITKFDLEAAFKALDEIELPKAAKVKANRPALTEIFSRRSKFDALMEEYYDINDMAELDNAKEAREAEVAQAKLARIEKIVDLDAESPEDILPSYVGKFIIQCPQCMTLFYKNPEDIEASEEDPNLVNVAEVCQHCGNEAGYTLIGKVGEATPDEQAEAQGALAVDVASTEDTLGAEDGDSALDDISLDEPTSDESDELGELDLDELELDIEDEENEKDEEKTEESFQAGAGGQHLVEELTEEAELDVSADDFKKLISSPEFKKPVSDIEVRTMMDELNDKKDGTDSDSTPKLEELGYDFDFLSDTIHDVFNTGKFSYQRFGNTKVPATKKLKDSVYKVVHPVSKASIIVKFDTTDKEKSILKFSINGKQFSTRYINKAQDFILGELEAAHGRQYDIAEKLNADKVHVNNEELTEGAFSKIKDKFIDTIDKVTTALKSREAKADWLLANTMKDYNDLEVNAEGKLLPDESNKRFNTFVVIGYTSRDNKGKLIKTAPEYNDKTLVMSKNGVRYKEKYEDADKIAKGWSMLQGNGPAFIYLANGKDDDNAVFLCEYFMGNLKNDQLDKYIKVAKDHLKRAKLLANDSVSSTNENLNAVMTEAEELQEAVLENLITSSLIESYGNVAGFRLAECAYTDGKFTINGTIYFTSGNTRKTTYTFTECLNTADGKVELQGLNEKLGLDKQFTITGYTDNHTFITESFKTTKK